MPKISIRFKKADIAEAIKFYIRAKMPSQMTDKSQILKVTLVDDEDAAFEDEVEALVEMGFPDGSNQQDGN